MIALVLPRLAAARLAIGAGIVWGSVLAGGLALLDYASCGVVCLDELAIVAAWGIGAGLVTVTPLIHVVRRYHP